MLHHRNELRVAVGSSDGPRYSVSPWILSVDSQFLPFFRTTSSTVPRRTSLGPSLDSKNVCLYSGLVEHLHSSYSLGACKHLYGTGFPCPLTTGFTSLPEPFTTNVSPLPLPFLQSPPLSPHFPSSPTPSLLSPLSPFPPSHLFLRGVLLFSLRH